MLSGIVFQLVAITVYMAFGAHFYWHYKNDVPVGSGLNGTSRGELTKTLGALLLAMAISTFFLFVR